MNKPVDMNVVMSCYNVIDGYLPQRLALQSFNLFTYGIVYLYVHCKISHVMNGFTLLISKVFLVVFLLQTVTIAMEQNQKPEIPNQPGTLFLVLDLIVKGTLDLTQLIVFHWICFKMKLVNISTQIKGNSAKEILKKITKLKYLGAALIISSIFAMGLIFVVLFNIDAPIIDQKSFQISLVAVFSAYNLFFIYLIIIFSKLGITYLKLFSPTENSIEYDAKFAMLAAVITLSLLFHLSFQYAQLYQVIQIVWKNEECSQEFKEFFSFLRNICIIVLQLVQSLFVISFIYYCGISMTQEAEDNSEFDAISVYLDEEFKTVKGSICNESNAETMLSQSQQQKQFDKSINLELDESIKSLRKSDKLRTIILENQIQMKISNPRATIAPKHQIMLLQMQVLDINKF